MKIAVIAFSNPIYCPYINLYTDAINQIDGCNFDVIYLKRFKDDSSLYGDNYISINWIGKGTNAAGIVEKAFNFYVFRKAVMRLLSRNGYDRVIVLTTIPAVLFAKYLRKKFPQRYIVDIRDYTKEHNKSFFQREKEVVSHSALNVISSKGFLTFLPKAEYSVCHNMRSVSVSDSETKFTKKKDGPIAISYVGSISYAEQCIRMIDLVAKDPRFCLYFYGNESGKPVVSDYVKKLSNERIQFKGAFMPNEKARIYRDSDIVFNCYGNDSYLVRCAISNKYYDGALYRRPLLVSPNTIMADLSGQFAFQLDPVRDKSLDTLYQWYRELDEKDFDDFAKRVIATSQEENGRTIKQIINAIK